MAVPPAPGAPAPPDFRRRWRYYRTEHGAEPVRDYLSSLPAADRLAVKAQMRRVQRDPRAARHLRGDLYEVRACRNGRAHRVTFVRDARWVLVALDAYLKTTPRTPPSRLRLADERARDWQRRGRSRRDGPGRSRQLELGR